MHCFFSVLLLLMASTTTPHALTYHVSPNSPPFIIPSTNSDLLEITGTTTALTFTIGNCSYTGQPEWTIGGLIVTNLSGIGLNVCGGSFNGPVVISGAISTVTLINQIFSAAMNVTASDNVSFVNVTATQSLLVTCNHTVDVSSTFAVTLDATTLTTNLTGAAVVNSALTIAAADCPSLRVSLRRSSLSATSWSPVTSATTKALSIEGGSMTTTINVNQSSTLRASATQAAGTAVLSTVGLTVDGHRGSIAMSIDDSSLTVHHEGGVASTTVTPTSVAITAAEMSRLSITNSTLSTAIPTGDASGVTVTGSDNCTGTITLQDSHMSVISTATTASVVALTCALYVVTDLNVFNVTFGVTGTYTAILVTTVRVADNTNASLSMRSVDCSRVPVCFFLKAMATTSDTRVLSSLHVDGCRFRCAGVAFFRLQAGAASGLTSITASNNVLQAQGYGTCETDTPLSIFELNHDEYPNVTMIDLVNNTVNGLSERSRIAGANALYTCADSTTCFTGYLNFVRLINNTVTASPAKFVVLWWNRQIVLLANVLTVQGNAVIAQNVEGVTTVLFEALMNWDASSLRLQASTVVVSGNTVACSGTASEGLGVAVNTWRNVNATTRGTFTAEGNNFTCTTTGSAAFIQVLGSEGDLESIVVSNNDIVVRADSRSAIVFSLVNTTSSKVMMGGRLLFSGNRIRCGLSPGSSTTAAAGTTVAGSSITFATNLIVVNATVRFTDNLVLDDGQFADQDNNCVTIIARRWDRCDYLVANNTVVLRESPSAVVATGLYAGLSIGGCFTSHEGSVTVVASVAINGTSSRNLFGVRFFQVVFSGSDSSAAPCADLEFAQLTVDLSSSLGIVAGVLLSDGANYNAPPFDSAFSIAVRNSTISVVGPKGPAGVTSTFLNASDVHPRAYNVISVSGCRISVQQTSPSPADSVMLGAPLQFNWVLNVASAVRVLDNQLTTTPPPGENASAVVVVDQYLPPQPSLIEGNNITFHNTGASSVTVSYLWAVKTYDYTFTVQHNTVTVLGPETRLVSAMMMRDAYALNVGALVFVENAFTTSNKNAAAVLMHNLVQPTAFFGTPAFAVAQCNTFNGEVISTWIASVGDLSFWPVVRSVRVRPCTLTTSTSATCSPDSTKASRSHSVSLSARSVTLTFTSRTRPSVSASATTQTASAASLSLRATRSFSRATISKSLSSATRVTSSWSGGTSTTVTARALSDTSTLRPSVSSSGVDTITLTQAESTSPSSDVTITHTRSAVVMSFRLSAPLMVKPLTVGTAPNYAFDVFEIQAEVAMTPAARGCVVRFDSSVTTQNNTATSDLVVDLLTRQPWPLTTTTKKNTTVVLTLGTLPANISGTIKKTFTTPALQMSLAPQCLNDPQAFTLQPNTVNIQVIYVPPPPPAVPLSVATTAAISGASNVVVGSVSGAGFAARSVAISGIADCDTSGIDGPLDIFSSPLQLEIGTASTRFHVGALVGDAVLVVLFMGIHLTVAVVKKLHVKSPTFTMEHALSWARFPSVSVFPVVYFLPVFVASGLTCVAYADDAFDRAVGFAAVLVVAVCLVWAARLLMGDPRLFRATFEWAKSAEERPQLPPGLVLKRPRLWLTSLFALQGEWIDFDDVARRHRPSFVRRYDLLFADYHDRRFARCFFLIDTGFSLAIAAVQGLLAASSCNSVQWVLLVLLMAYPATLVWRRPHHSPVVLYSTLWLAILQLASGSIAIAASLVEPTSDALDQLNNAALAVTVLTVCSLLLLSFFELVRTLVRWFVRRVVNLELRQRLVNFFTDQRERDVANLESDWMRDLMMIGADDVPVQNDPRAELFRNAPCHEPETTRDVVRDEARRPVGSTRPQSRAIEIEMWSDLVAEVLQMRHDSVTQRDSA